MLIINDVVEGTITLAEFAKAKHISLAKAQDRLDKHIIATVPEDESPEAEFAYITETVYSSAEAAQAAEQAAHTEPLYTKAAALSELVVGAVIEYTLNGKTSVGTILSRNAQGSVRIKNNTTGKIIARAAEKLV